MNEKKILFIAYLYPPVAGTGLPGVQRMVRFMRYLNRAEKYVLTLRTDQYPEFFSLDNKTPLPINHETIIRTGTADLFRVLLKGKNFFRSLLKRDKISDLPNADSSLYALPDKKSDTVQTNRFTHIKDMISDLLRFPDYAYSWIVPAVYEGIKAVRKYRIEMIVATGMPWSSLIIAYLIKVFTEKKLIVDFRDPWVGNPYLEKNRGRKFLEKIFESLVVHKADLIIANTDSLKEQMDARYPEMKTRIMVLPNGYDAEDFKDIPEIRLPQEKFVISHAGFLYLKRDPVTLLKAMEIIKEKYPEFSSMIQFHHIGNINLDYDVEKYCRNKGIRENVILASQMDHKKCLGYLAASDVLLIIQPGTKSQIPSKLYEYIYLDKPVLAITEKDSALGRILAGYGFGEAFEPDEHEKIAAFLCNLAESKRKKEMIRPSYYYKEKFDARHIISEFEQRLNDL
jgi:glycosyltransferase involved in cell wall biosynthesis